jgi:hypothetical protein
MNVGKTQNPVMVAILSYITCGIYGIYYLYTVICELNTITGKEIVNPILGAIIYPYGWYLVDKEIAELNKSEELEYKSNFVLWLILTFVVCGVGIAIAPYQISGSLNKVWEKRSGGAAPDAGTDAGSDTGASE